MSKKKRSKIITTQIGAEMTATEQQAEDSVCLTGEEAESVALIEEDIPIEEGKRKPNRTSLIAAQQEYYDGMEKVLKMKKWVKDEPDDYEKAFVKDPVTGEWVWNE